MHVVNITRYVIRIKKHLHNRIEIIKIESNRKEYESLHSYLKPLTKLHKPWAYKRKFKVFPLVQEYVYKLCDIRDHHVSRAFLRLLNFGVLEKDYV